MVEVEIKVPVVDENQLITQLKMMGFAKSKSMRESDIYFDNEQAQIKNSDGALRICSCENRTDHTSNVFLTYKGPKMDAISMTRKEFETQIGDMETGKQILMSLGFNRLYSVVKTRQYYVLGQVTACLDQVEDLGTFLELEIIVENDDEKEQALSVLLDLIKRLGYKKEDLIRRSYLSMLQG